MKLRIFALILSLQVPLARAEVHLPKSELPEAKEAVDAERAVENESYAEWLWKDQLAPTLRYAGDERSLWSFVGVTAATVFAHQHDADFRKKYGDEKGVGHDAGKIGSVLGSGFPGILVAAGQLYWDTDEGLAHARALALTSASHITIASIANRKRPNGRSLSFPSGHTSSSFATASSLAYSYGPWVGVPALGVAGFIGFSRISNNAHWLSDIVFGAALGVYWARASAKANVKPDEISYFPVYESDENGPKLGMGLERRF